MSSSSNFPFPARGAVSPDRPMPALPRQWTNLGMTFLRRARARPMKLFARDTTGNVATYGEALQNSAALARVLMRESPGSAGIGLLIPPSVPAAVANLATAFSGKWSVNLNYAAGQDAVNSAIRQCRLPVVVTSKKAIDKFGFKLEADVIFLEDLVGKVNTADKAVAAMARYLPMPQLLWPFLPGLGASLDSMATVLFSSGSTGEPKGIMLSHRNLLSNAWQIKHHAGLNADDAVVGYLPFGHSFGLGITLWTVAILQLSAHYHHNPLDPRTIGEMMHEHKASLMAGTPTLMRSFLKRCTKEQFQHVRWLLLGSEKMKPELQRDLLDKLGVLGLEGYGCTELSPFVAANVPQDVLAPDGQTVIPGYELGTVGQPAVGTAIAIVDINTGKLLPRGKEHEGLIFVAGPQVMMGYFGKPELSSQVLRNGFYCTGDIGSVDHNGRLRITDRLSRFAKVGGEMVPLANVEASIRQVAGCHEMAVALTAIPDQERGERLFVVHTADLNATPSEITTRLKPLLPALWMPKTGDFVKVDALPVGPTGKLDLKAVKQIAIDASK